MWDKKLFSTKWFDYRQMTPLQATTKYMSDYEKIYRRIYAENINYEVAKNIKFSFIASISKKMTFTNDISKYISGAYIIENKVTLKNKRRIFWLLAWKTNRLCFRYAVQYLH